MRNLIKSDRRLMITMINWVTLNRQAVNKIFVHDLVDKDKRAIISSHFLYQLFDQKRVFLQNLITSLVLAYVSNSCFKKYIKSTPVPPF